MSKLKGGQQGNRIILTVRVVVSHQLHCTGPGTGGCNTKDVGEEKRNIIMELTSLIYK